MSVNGDLCLAMRWSDDGRLRLRDCPERADWEINEGYLSCDAHIADYLSTDGEPNTVRSIRP